MNSLIEGLKEASAFKQGLFVMLVGMAGVFLVLLLFYLFIKLIVRVVPEKKT